MDARFWLHCRDVEGGSLGADLQLGRNPRMGNVGVVCMQTPWDLGKGWRCWHLGSGAPTDAQRRLVKGEADELGKQYLRLAVKERCPSGRGYRALNSGSTPWALP